MHVSYVMLCRQDVQAVFKSFDEKWLETLVVSMRKRLDKHCGSPDGKVSHVITCAVCF